jgi:hypothetical protein
MVVDHKGRLLHATAKLATLLGQSVSNLVKMELSTLLPQPICQMHGAWFKVSVPAFIAATGIGLLARCGNRHEGTVTILAESLQQTG